MDVIHPLHNKKSVVKTDKMAAPDAMAFHAMKRADAVRNSQDRVKAIQETGYRMQHSPYLKGIPYTSTGSKTGLFFVNPDQSDKVLEPALRGGVLNKNRGAVEKMLKRRAENVVNMMLAQQNLPPAEEPIETLTEEDSLKIELNQVIQTLFYYASQSHSGVDYVKFVEQVYKATRLVMRLLPVLDEEDIVEIIRIFDDVSERVEVLMDESNDDAEKYALFSLVRDILLDFAEDGGFLSKFLQAKGLSDKDKRTLIRSFGKSMTTKLRKLLSIIPARQRQLIKAAEEEAAAAAAEATSAAPPMAPTVGEEGEEEELTPVTEIPGQAPPSPRAPPRSAFEAPTGPRPSPVTPARAVVADDALNRLLERYVAARNAKEVTEELAVEVSDILKDAGLTKESKAVLKNKNAFAVIERLKPILTDSQKRAIEYARSQRAAGKRTL
jgi:hypothetical protein